VSSSAAAVGAKEHRRGGACPGRPYLIVVYARSGGGETRRRRTPNVGVSVHWPPGPRQSPPTCSGTPPPPPPPPQSAYSRSDRGPEQSTHIARFDIIAPRSRATLYFVVVFVSIHTVFDVSFFIGFRFHHVFHSVSYVGRCPTRAGLKNVRFSLSDKRLISVPSMI